MESSFLSTQKHRPRIFKIFGEFRFWVLIFAILQPFFSCGLIYGWAGLLLILKGENTYAFKCDHSTTKTVTENGIVECAELDSYLNFISSFVAASQMIFAFLGGVITDIIGPKFVCISQALIALGTVFMAIAQPASSDQVDLFLVGIILQNCLGLVVAPSFLHYAYLYPDAFYFICAIMSASVGISSIIFPIFHVIWASTSLTRSDLFTIYSVIVGTFFFFSLIQPFKKLQMGGTISFKWRTLTIQVKPPSHVSSDIPTDASNSKFNVSSTKRVPSDIAKNTINCEYQSIEDSSPEMTDKPILLSKDDQAVPAPSQQLKDPYISKIFFKAQSLLSLYKKIIRVVVKTRYFYLTLCLGIFWAFTFLFYLTSINLQVSHMTDNNNEIDHYTELFSWIAPFGIFASLTSAFIIDNWGFRWAICFQLLLGITHISFNLSGQLQIQIITFLTYTFGQESLFSIIFSIITEFFPSESMCSIVGLFLTIQGLTIFTINPIVTLILEAGLGFMTINIVFIVFGILTTLIPFLADWKVSSLKTAFNFS